LIISAGLVAGIFASLGACQTTTQRCMEEREACVEACKGKEKEGDCNDACGKALNKCMAE
jgi:hypothetical protein